MVCVLVVVMDANTHVMELAKMLVKVVNTPVLEAVKIPADKLFGMPSLVTKIADDGIRFDLLSL